LPAGLTVVAQENCKAEMVASAGSRNPAPQDRLPTKTYGKTDKLTIDGVHFRLYHWAPAHTSGDLVVYLPGEKIVFTGDVIATTLPDPLIHLEKNGSSEGWITTAKGIAGLDADQFVPGHGDIQTKAAVQKRLTDAEAKRAKIKDLIAQGKSLDEIKTAVGDAPAAPGGRGPAFASFTDVVYKELKK
jgi:glyoxylase-like metal-dependent hydrolase (beta-lactamase superfamily II)